MQQAEHLAVTLPLIGQVQFPPPDHLAYYGAIAALAALEILEWPVAVALAAGHALASQHHNRTISELGEALEEA